MWRPDVGVWCLLWLLFTLFFEQELLLHSYLTDLYDLSIHLDPGIPASCFHVLGLQLGHDTYLAFPHGLFMLVLQMRYAPQHFSTLQCEMSNDIPRLYSGVTSDISPHR